MKESEPKPEGGVEQFRLQPGKLYVRRMGNSQTLSFELPGEQWRMRSVAESDGPTTSPKRDTYVEALHEERGKSESGNEIENVLATDQDLRQMLSSFETKHVSLQEWLDEVSDLTGLDQDEKERLSRIAREISEAKDK